MLDVKQKIRTHQDSFQSQFYAAGKVSFFAAFLKKAHQRLEIGIAYRPAVSAPRERSHDRPRARLFLARTCGRAHENAPPARRIARSLHVIGPAQLNSADPGQNGHIARIFVRVYGIFRAQHPLRRHR